MGRVATLAVSVALLCSVASAAGTWHLDLMPLPRSALGPGSAALVLAPDSGVASNAYAARDAGHGFTAAELAKRGRITGYALDYVLPIAVVPQTRHELLGVRTIAELYRGQATAIRGLAFWRWVTQQLAGRHANANAITVAVSAFRARIGEGSFAFELTDRRAGQPLYYVGDIVFRTGRLLGSVFVSATDDIGLRGRTLHLADSLASRIERVLNGGVRGLVSRPTG
jgi:hypothetical protein